MGFQIQDGTGSSKKVKVNSNNRIETDWVIITSLSTTSKQDGNAYTVGTDGIFSGSFSTGTDNALLYCKNNEDKDLFVDVCVVSQDVAGIYKFIKNPTAGTLITNGTSTSPLNLNFGSSNVAVLDVIKLDAVGRTFTDGTTITYSRNPAGLQPLDFLGTVVVPKGSSFGITYDPDATGTVNLSVFFFVHLSPF